MVKTIILISWMVRPCIHRSVYEFESGYISPAPSLSFLLNQRQGGCFVSVSTADCRLKKCLWVILSIISVQGDANQIPKVEHWIPTYSLNSALLLTRAPWGFQTPREWMHRMLRGGTEGMECMTMKLLHSVTCTFICTHGWIHLNYIPGY
jgi:hypothetical protein